MDHYCSLFFRHILRFPPPNLALCLWEFRLLGVQSNNLLATPFRRKAHSTVLHRGTYTEDGSQLSLPSTWSWYFLDTSGFPSVMRVELPQEPRAPFSTFRLLDYPLEQLVLEKRWATLRGWSLIVATTTLKVELEPRSSRG